MKFLRNLLLILTTIFIFELTFSKDVNAACAKTGDVLDVVSDWCETQPDEYEIVI